MNLGNVLWDLQAGQLACLFQEGTGEVENGVLFHRVCRWRVVEEKGGINTWQGHLGGSISNHIATDTSVGEGPLEGDLPALGGKADEESRDGVNGWGGGVRSLCKSLPCPWCNWCVGIGWPGGGHIVLPSGSVWGGSPPMFYRWKLQECRWTRRRSPARVGWGSRRWLWWLRW